MTLAMKLDESRKIGIEEGRKEGRIEGIRSGQKELLLEIGKTKTPKEIADMLGVDEQKIIDILNG